MSLWETLGKLAWAGVRGWEFGARIRLGAGGLPVQMAAVRLLPGQMVWLANIVLVFTQTPAAAVSEELGALAGRAGEGAGCGRPGQVCGQHVGTCHRSRGFCSRVCATGLHRPSLRMRVTMLN